MKLTPSQKGLLSRVLIQGEFIILSCAGDDRIAKNLQAKGLGSFVSNAWRYSWRNRDGFTNNFYPNEKGLAACSL